MSFFTIKIKKQDTIVRVFDNSKKAERFINMMQNRGYELVNMSDGKKDYSLGKGLVAGALLGPVGLIFGRGKSRITVTMKLKNKAAEKGGTDDLEKLAELKAKGVITEEEFAAKKKQILGI